MALVQQWSPICCLTALRAVAAAGVAVGIAVRPVGADGVAPDGTADRGPRHRCVVEVRSGEVGVREVRIQELGVGEDGVGEVGARKLLASIVAPLKSIELRLSPERSLELSKASDRFTPGPTRPNRNSQFGGSRKGVPCIASAVTPKRSAVNRATPLSVASAGVRKRFSWWTRRTPWRSTLDW